MTKYFEVHVTTNRQYFVETSDNETQDSIQDYVRDIAENEGEGEVFAGYPIVLDEQVNIDYSRLHADIKIVN